MNTGIKKVTAIVVSVLLWILIILTGIFVFVTLSAKQNDGVPKLLGTSPIVVLSDSMKGDKADNFQKGDLVVIGPVKDVSTLKKDDIITFWDFIDGKKAMNTHRITAIENTSSGLQFTTAGDNNVKMLGEAGIDVGKKTQNDIVGVYKYQIKGAGNIMNFLGSKWGFLFCLVLPLFIFFIWRLIKLVLAAAEYKKAKLEEKPE